MGKNSTWARSLITSAQRPPHCTTKKRDETRRFETIDDFSVKPCYRKISDMMTTNGGTRISEIKSGPPQKEDLLLFTGKKLRPRERGWSWSLGAEFRRMSK